MPQLLRKSLLPLLLGLCLVALFSHVPKEARPDAPRSPSHQATSTAAPRQTASHLLSSSPSASALPLTGSPLPASPPASDLKSQISNLKSAPPASSASPLPFFSSSPLPASPLASPPTPSEILAQTGDISDPENRAQAVERIRAWENARLEDARTYSLSRGFPLRHILPDGRIQELIGLDDSGEPVVRTTTNVNAAISTGADLLRAAPYNLNGSGLTVGLWDGGAVRTTHQEFGIRATVKDSAAVIDHATHVAGTIGAAGVNASLKGMAPSVLIDSYDWTNDTSEQNTRGASYPGESGKIYLSNHSYGTVTGWNYTGDTGGVNAKWLWYGSGTTSASFDPDFGKYNTDSAASDSSAYTYPYYLILRSAGNDRGDNPANGDIVSLTTAATPVYTYSSATHPAGDGAYKATGYDTIHDDAAAKNVLTIGSIGDAVSGGTRSLAGAYMSYYSCWGPTDDGRIKPDLVANGEALTSALSTSDTASGIYSGTSMATPNATGSAALVIQAYHQLFPGQFPRASTLKGLLIQTADDLGNPGPDYKFGWGLVNAKAAVDKLQSYKDFPGTPHLVEDRLVSSTRTSVSHAFTWDGTSPIRVTLCWTDPAGTAVSSGDLTNNRTAKLVNNLNLTLANPSGGTHLPYVMPHVGDWTTATLNSDAVTGVNNTDNVEQVYLASPGTPGVYTATVSFSGSLTNSVQNFSLLVSGAADTATGPTPTLATVSPATSTGAAMTLTLAGSDLRAGCAAKLTFAGQADVPLGNLEPLGDTLKARFNAAGMTPGLWNVVVTNPDGQSATLAEAFTVIGNLWFDNLEGSTSGWSATGASGTTTWALGTALSKSTTHSFFSPGPATPAEQILTMPAFSIPTGTTNLKFSFWHRYAFQTNSRDGGVLELSVDGGSWFDVASPGSGAAFTTGAYNGTLSSASNPLNGRDAWVGTRSTFGQVVVSLTDLPKYQGKTFRARWRLATNSGTASTGWYVDDIALLGSPPGNTAPVLASPAASPATVTATTTALSVTASDNAGEAALTYSWSSDGPAPISFSANNSNAAKNTNATFTQPGSYTFTVTVTDTGNLTASDTVAVTVNAVAVSLAVSPPTATVNAGETQTFAASALDQFGQNITPVFAWDVSGGGTISPSGLFTAGETAGGPHTVTASAGSASNTASVTVIEPNFPPVATDDAFDLTEDTILALDSLTGLLANDSDADPSDTLTAELVEGPVSGNLTLNPDGSFTYTPTPNFNGPITFTYKLFDGTVFSDPATVTITVNPVNDPPVAVADAYVTDEDTTLTIPALIGLLANDSDAEASSLTATLVSPPASGTLDLNPDGSFTFTPALNQHGPVTFTYAANDGELSSTPATVTITVNPVNDAPVAVADAYVTDEDTTLTIPALTGLLANDSDPDITDTLTAELVEAPTSGNLTLNPDGSFTFTPALNQHGPVTFTYAANDGELSSTPATVTITVNPINDAPVNLADAYTTDEDTTLNVPALTGLIANDSDPDITDTLTAELVEAPTSGNLTLNPDGSLAFSPAENFHGDITFTYKVFDGSDYSEPATVTITVNPVNDPPVFTSDPITENATGGSAFIGQLSATDADFGDTLSFTKQTGPAWLDVSPAGSLTGSPTNAEAGLIVFTVAVSDGTVTVTATLNLTVTASGPSFAAFTGEHFSPAEQADPLVSGPDADPDQDGVSNLLEYAFAMDPRVPSLANLPKTIIVPESADAFVGVTYTRLKGATDLIFTSEFSSVPETTGFTASPATQVSLTDNLDGTETVTLRDNTPVTPATPRFVRLRVDQN